MKIRPNSLKLAKQTLEKLTQQSVFIKTSHKWRADKNKAQHKKNRRLLQRDLNLKKQNHQSASVSHTQHIGGYALCQRGIIGFDLEPASRTVSPKAAKRIGSPQERRLITNPLHLWVIKEASWKALKGPQQPKTISHIKIDSFRKLRSHNIYEYSYKSSKINTLENSCFGVLVISPRTVLGISIFIPQL
jgi:phosphopantetheinyl transferase (holo-ACP synthase)